MVLLLDIGNTNTHLGLAQKGKLFRHQDIPTASWRTQHGAKALKAFVGGKAVEGVAICSVVPQATVLARRTIRRLFKTECFELNGSTLRCIGIDYPAPRTIGPDRLADAAGGVRKYGAPCIVIDFGTAATFEVVDKKGNYIGGVIAPGLAVMTEYLHQKTALLPQIRIRDLETAIGRSTEEAMLSAAVHGYRGLVRELIRQLKKQLRVKSLPVIATGGYASLLARKLPEITAVEPLLTLEGLLLAWEAAQSGVSHLNQPSRSPKLRRS